MRAARWMIVVLAAWTGSVAASCRMPPCTCPPMPPIVGGLMEITHTRGKIRGLVGGEVDVRREKVVMRYSANGNLREIVFAVTPDR